MPHKHTRRPGGASGKDFDLPPTSRARALSVGKKSASTEQKEKGKKRKRATNDDTPREFKRLMELQKHMTNKSAGSKAKPRDRGEDMPRQKKSKVSPADEEIKVEDGADEDVEGEDSVEDDKADAKKLAKKAKHANGLSDPAWNIKGPMEKNMPVLKEKSSRLQRKIEKKVALWRTEDERLRKKRDDDIAKYREQEEERIADLLEKSGMSSAAIDDPDLMKELGLGDDMDEAAEKEIMAKRGKKKRKGKDEDDFAVLQDKREKPKGLHDVVQAPPQLQKMKDRFRTQKPIGTGDGGLKRKADLSEARLEVIKRYREMMGKKREGQ